MIFDYDGTLADSAPWLAGVINGVARTYRFRTIAPGEFECLRDRDVQALMRHLGVARWKLPFIARHMRKLATRDRAQIGLFPGIGFTLRALHAAGVRLAIVSSNTQDNIEHALGPELASLIERYSCGASVFGKARKIRRLLKDLDLAPSEVLSVGDELRDIEAAREAGVASGAVTWGYADAAALAAKRPDLMFTRLEDMSARLAGVEA